MFDPELKSPIKTLDLPLGGSKGVRAAVQVLIEISLVANRNQQGHPRRIGDMDDDFTGTHTVGALSNTLNLVRRITGNSPGSLGLHPAVYFYGPTGRHSSAMFMGTVSLFGQKLANNDPTFFHNLSAVRQKLERLLTNKKDLIATLLQKHLSQKRVEIYGRLLNELIKKLQSENEVTDEDIVRICGLEGKIIVGGPERSSTDFSDDTKSKVFLNSALNSALTCPICRGFLDAAKAATYDHIYDRELGGIGHASNCQMVHPFCNSAIKNGQKAQQRELGAVVPGLDSLTSLAGG